MDPKPNSITDVLATLGQTGVRLLIAGGVAAQLYGSERLTMDLDVIPSLAARDWKKLLEILRSLDFEPVDAQWVEIENLTRVRKWAQPRDAISLRFHNEANALDIDVLFAEGRNFEQYARRARLITGPGLTLQVIDRDDLIAMKRRAGRPKDLEDIAAITAAPEPPRAL